MSSLMPMSLLLPFCKDTAVGLAKTKSRMEKPVLLGTSLPC